MPCSDMPCIAYVARFLGELSIHSSLFVCAVKGLFLVIIVAADVGNDWQSYCFLSSQSNKFNDIDYGFWLNSIAK